MKIAKYLVKEGNIFFETSEYFENDSEVKKVYKNKPFWRLNNTQFDTDSYYEFNDNDVEEVIYSQQYAKIPEAKLKYQYEWRYQKSMLWFITPEKFESDDDFKNYISKAVVLDLIDFRRFVKPSHKEIGI